MDTVYVKCKHCRTEQLSSIQIQLGPGVEASNNSQNCPSCGKMFTFDKVDMYTKPKN